MNTTQKINTYCKFCKNRLLDKRNGVVCSLTNKKPMFEDDCKDFCLDELALKRIKRRLKNKIYEDFREPNRIEYFLNYKLKNKVPFIKVRPVIKDKFEDNFVYEIFRETSSLKEFLLYLILGSFIAIPVDFIRTNEFPLKLLMVFLLFITIAVLIYFKNKKELMIKTNQEGFSYVDDYVMWREILFSKYLFKKEYHSRVYGNGRVVLGLTSGKIIELNIFELEISVAELMKIIDAGRNSFANIK